MNQHQMDNIISRWNQTTDARSWERLEAGMWLLYQFLTDGDFTMETLDDKNEELSTVLFLAFIASERARMQEKSEREAEAATSALSQPVKS